MRQSRLTPWRTARLGAVVVALGLAAAGCADAAGPGAAATYELRAFNGRPLPTQAASVGEGATLDIVSASLQFAAPSGELGARGDVAATRTLRVAGPGEPPREKVQAAAGTYARRGDTLAVAFSNGAAETFVVEAGGQSLRTVAAQCGGDCDAVLNISEYERRAPED